MKTEQEIINSIEVKYPQLRQSSKTVTFLCTYFGGAYALRKTSGMPYEDAEKCVERFHKFNYQSIEWALNKLNAEAYKKGYVTVAGGLKIRSESLKNGGLYGADSNPKHFHKYEKTLTNAFTQSFGMITVTTLNRMLKERDKAANKGLMKRNDVVGSATIHDANYFMVNSDPKIMSWFHSKYHECITKYEVDYPELSHPVVKIDGDTEVFYPDWGHSTKVKNNEDMEDYVESVLMKDKPQKLINLLGEL